MESNPAPEKKPHRPEKDSSGVAIAMVLAAILMLSVLVTEFTYIAQMNQKVAFDALDQVRAHYLAKSAFKLSLLRLKAYQQVKGVFGGGGKDGSGGAGGGVPGLPKGMLEKIWSFPFFYPLPSDIPGLSPTDKESIDKFQKESSLDGRFSAVIESESSRYNLNMILSSFAPSAQPSGGPSPTPPPEGGTPPPPPPGGTPVPTPAFDPEKARQSLTEYLENVLRQKIEDDEEFASQYRDFRLMDLTENIFAWADRTYESKSSERNSPIKPKGAPFYSVSELHMIQPMDDQLYSLFAPTLTASTTPGININSMKDATLRSLVPQMTKDEVTEFFKFRDTDEEDNSFKSEDDFYKYLQNNVAAFKGTDDRIKAFREQLKVRNIRIVTDETDFKITVQATVNQSTRLLEAWVTTNTGKKKGSNPPAGQPPASGQPTAPSAPSAPDAGLRVTFMRFL